MDNEDQAKPATPSSVAGHESHGVHICHRCGWPFPNPHPSSKHRRAHKRICGTIEGYTKLIHAVSDDEHHSDDDKEETPSPKIEKRIVKESGSSAGGVEERSNKPEDELFSDAVTEFSDSGISPAAEERIVDKPPTKLLDSPIDDTKVEDEVFGTADSHAKDADKTEENDVNTISNSAETQIKLSDSEAKPSVPLVKDRDGSHEDKVSDLVEPSNTVPTKPDPTKVSTHVDTVEASGNKDQQEEAVYVLSVPNDIPLVDHAEALIKDFRDHKTKYSTDRPVLGPVGDNGVENRSMVDAFEIKTAEVKIEEGRTSGNGESSKESVVSEHANTEFSAFVPAVIIEEEAKVAEAQPLETSNTIHESTDNLSEENVSPRKHSVVTPDERTEIAAAERTSQDVDRAKLESVHEHAPKVVEEADHSVPVLAEDLASENCSEAFTQETGKEPESGIEVEQKIVASLSAGSKDGDGVGILERSEKLILEQSEQSHNASRVSETLVNETDDKLTPSQEFGVDASVGSSSRNSLEGNWGSVSVLSTASIDAENAQSIGKLEIAADKSRLGKSDAFEGPSLVGLKEETVDQKASEIKAAAVQTSQPPRSEASRADWRPGEANVSNETEGRKRNEEAIEKVTNWSTGGPTTAPIKNLVSEAKISNPKQSSNMIKKDEVSEKFSETGKSNLALETPPVNQESSPPKSIDDGKKGRKKARGRASWIPFVCCSSVNVN